MVVSGGVSSVGNVENNFNVQIGSNTAHLSLRSDMRTAAGGLRHILSRIMNENHVQTTVGTEAQTATFTPTFQTNYDPSTSSGISSESRRLTLVSHSLDFQSTSTTITSSNLYSMSLEVQNVLPDARIQDILTLLQRNGDVGATINTLLDSERSS